jgi:hypothetical protein
MRKLYVCNTRIGPFYIVESGGRYHPYYDGEPLGTYSNPQQAVDDLASGQTFPIPGGTDTAALGIPKDLSKWARFQ